MSSKTEIFRIVDANVNRASEGLRVVEDYARFARNDLLLGRALKQLRHKLSEVARSLSDAIMLKARNSEEDVGRDSDQPSEYARTSLLDVAFASCKRVEQALRCLEEYGKLIDADSAREFELLRYRMYTLEKALLAVSNLHPQLRGTQIYVLIDGMQDEATFRQQLESLLAAGASLVQFRDKNLKDRELRNRVKLTRELTAAANCLLIVNDRPDIAALTRADGVHVGQEELSVSDARRIVGPNAIVGVSTHSLEQAQQAILDGADYIGVGPVFPSRTKAFHDYPGIDLVREVVAGVSVPAFAIGGITLRNARQVVDAGAHQVAVASAVWREKDPGGALRRFRELLETVVDPA